MRRLFRGLVLALPLAGLPAAAAGQAMDIPTEAEAVELWEFYQPPDSDPSPVELLEFWWLAKSNCFAIEDGEGAFRFHLLRASDAASVDAPEGTRIGLFGAGWRDSEDWIRYVGRVSERYGVTILPIPEVLTGEPGPVHVVIRSAPDLDTEIVAYAHSCDVIARSFIDGLIEEWNR